MPFIRYDTGDVGVLDETGCPCGRGLPLLRRIEGRADDFLRTTDGRSCSPSVVVNVIKRFPGFRQFRIIQEQNNKISALIVAGEGSFQEYHREFKKTMKRILGEKMRVVVHPVKSIPPDPSGKIRSVISRINTSD